MNVLRELVGVWVLDPSDTDARQAYGETSLQFTELGDLVYTIFGVKSNQQILLKYWIEGDFIFTDQPSNPGIEKSLFRLKDNRLSINFQNFEARYVRA